MPQVTWDAVKHRQHVRQAEVGDKIRKGIKKGCGRAPPDAFSTLIKCINAGNGGLRDPRSIIQGRNVLFGVFNGKVPLRPGKTKPGERPFLVARVGLNRSIVLEAAARAGGCLESGSGGVIWQLRATLPRKIRRQPTLRIVD